MTEQHGLPPSTARPKIPHCQEESLIKPKLVNHSTGSNDKPQITQSRVPRFIACKRGHSATARSAHNCQSGWGKIDDDPKQQARQPLEFPKSPRKLCAILRFLFRKMGTNNPGNDQRGGVVGNSLRKQRTRQRRDRSGRYGRRPIALQGMLVACPGLPSVPRI